MDPTTFAELIKELTEHPISVNHDRTVAGKGKSQAFGIIRRWSYRPYLSRNTWMRPRLYQLLLDYAAAHVTIPWDGITVNDSYLSNKHRDKGNEGESYTVSFGDFTGGELCMELSGESVQIDTHNKPCIFNGSTTLHWTGPFVGRRFCLVFYRIIWPTKFLPRYRVDCQLLEDGLQIHDEYDQSIQVVDRRGKVVREIQRGIWREWIGRLTMLAQPSRNQLPPTAPESPASHEI
jgi:hypothetical protein